MTIPSIFRLATTTLIALSVVFPPVVSAADQVTHAVAIHGEPRYPADFPHLDYVNPDAPRGGIMRRYTLGTFDSLNPFILKGVKAAGLAYLYDTLTTQPGDESAVEYGLIAESIEVPEDRSSVTFKLRPEATFHDGERIKPEDVVFSLETLKRDGHPLYQSYFGDIVEAVVLDEYRVRFSFSEGFNNELPVITGQLPVLPKHYWTENDFTKSTLVPPLGSGPYTVESLDAGRSITWHRVKDYWAQDLPINVGRYNVDVLRFDYYRDETIALEAFKSGDYDIRRVRASKEWARGYDFPAVEQGLVKREEIAHELPTGMQAFIINTRRPQFADARVREALSYAFDFEWTNENLFYGAYKRTESYFSNSELAATGVPQGEELELLERYRDQLPVALFTEPFTVPKTDGTGNIRANLRQATRLLNEAGWKVTNGALTHQETGETLSFEFLIRDPLMERIVLPYIRNLERLGIEASIRSVDIAQYQARIENFDFDVTTLVLSQSLSPGNEQREMWGSAEADVVGSRNYMGITSPVVDALIDGLIQARTRNSLVNHTRALDRVLLWHHYVVPHFHIRTFRVAYWDKFERPAISPRYELGLDTWWVDVTKAQRLAGESGD